MLFRSTWARFLVVTPTTKELIPKDPFKVLKSIVSLAGKPIEVKKLRSGDLLVEFGKRSHSECFQKCSSFAGAPVKVERHKFLNSSRGLLRDRSYALEDMLENEIQESLESQGVIGVRRMTKFVGGRKQPTNT